MKIKLDAGAFTPTKAYDRDAGFDLRCRERIVVLAGQSVIVDTGVHVELPPHTFGKLESKSGLHIKHDIVCLGGVIDEGYTGSICVKLYNLGSERYVFEEGEKIVQLIIQPYMSPEIELIEEVEDLEPTDRGANGFGSSGR